MDVKFEENVYRTVIRPALMYWAETLGVKKAQENNVEIAAMRMLRWMCGASYKDQQNKK